MVGYRMKFFILVPARWCALCTTEESLCLERRQLWRCSPAAFRKKRLLPVCVLAHPHRGLFLSERSRNVEEQTSRRLTAHNMPASPSPHVAHVRADPRLATAIPSHVMVAGATGEVGRSLVAHLSASGVEHITALVRNPKADIAAELGGLKGVQLVTCSDVADQDALEAAMDTVIEQTGIPHAFVSCMGISRSKIGRMDTDANGNKVPAGEQYKVAATNLVRAAKRIGVKRYVYISSGFVTRPRAPIALMLNSFAGNVLGYHAVVEDIVRDEVSSSAEMDYVIVRPGGLDHGGPGDGVQITQGDRITGGSVRRSRVAEVLAQTLDDTLLPRRSGADAFNRGVTFEVAGSKTDNAQGKVNSEVSPERWQAMLGRLEADPVWISPSTADHMAAHRAAVSTCRRNCSVFCLLLLAGIVCASLAAAGVFS